MQNKFVNTCYTLAKRLYKISRLFHHLSPPPLPEDKGGEGWRTGKKNERCSLKQASLLSASTLTDASQKNNNIYYPNCTVIFCNFSGPKLGVIYSRGSTFSQIEILEIEYVKRLYTYFDSFLEFQSYCKKTSVAEPKLFSFGSSSDFDHNFGSSSSYCHILAL